ncbi:hypothetical protein DFP92_102242 [Yoonia sediminilitoris]|uniref:Uncharacterized protein n=2 Tax=Yoonia sediminilitoris TaxID=1286148 RepID=A0A2T6KLY8_9RHOB|nr:hypothetical protein C8N45_102242 [Yoonia sediminilitoris]RCW97527.1 hypothetical protein DFP92_102242 [Yoonia sediminilitoris]
MSSKFDLRDALGPAGSAKADPNDALPVRPERPSIAVLAFENLSGDPEQEYFLDGISDDNITALSRSPWLFIIARNTTFTYKGSRVDVRRMAKELPCLIVRFAPPSKRTTIISFKRCTLPISAC